MPETDDLITDQLMAIDSQTWKIAKRLTFGRIYTEL